MNFIIWLGTGWRRWPVLGAALFFVAILALSVFLPYQALIVRGVEVEPPEVCEGEGVRVTLDRRWSEPDLIYGEPTSDLSSRWRNIETGAEYPAIIARDVQPDLSVLDGKVRSDLVREAPPDPGVYRLITTYRVSGRVLLLPAYQDVGPLESNDVVVVDNCLSETSETLES